ncbi:MAG: flagellar export protein FliJ [Pirellulales bacterium]
MSKFNFRLETLLKLKVTVRDQRNAELKGILTAQDTLIQQKKELDAEVQSALGQTLEDAKPGLLDVDRLISGHQELLRLKMAVKEKILLERQLEPHIKQRQQALIDADQEVRILEKHKENQSQQHLQVLNEREAKQMDELATQVHYRNNWRKS